MKKRHLWILFFTLIGFNLILFTLLDLKLFGVNLLEDEIALSILNAILGIALSYGMLKMTTKTFVYRLLLFLFTFLVTFQYKVPVYVSITLFVLCVIAIAIFCIDLFSSKRRRLNPKVLSNDVTYISLFVYTMVIPVERFLTSADLLYHPGFTLILGLFIGFLIQYLWNKIKERSKNFNVTSLM